MNDQFMNEDQVQSSLSYQELFRRLWPFAKKEKGLLFFALSTVFLTAGISRTIPFLIGHAIDDGVLKNDIELFARLTWLYLILEVSKTFFSFFNLYIFQKFGNRMLFHVREKLVAHTQSLPLQFFNKTPTGRIVTRLTNDANALGELFTEGVVSVFIQAVMLISITVAVLSISWKLGLAALISAPFFTYGSYLLSEKIRLILREQKKILSKMNSFLSENFNGIKVVQLYNRIPKNIQLFNEQSDSYRNSTLDSVFAYSLMQPIINLFTATTMTVSLYYGGYLTLQGALPLGALVAFVINIQDFIPPLREILEKYQQFQNSLASAERIFHLLDEPTERTDNKDNFASYLEPQTASFQGRIEFRDLSFQYEPQLPFVLKNIELDIAPGQSVAFVGRTGSGKSTLISLLQGFYLAPAGKLFLDNKPIEAWSLEKLRSMIGVVQQDVFIFRGTIAENISLRDPRITEADVLRATEQIGYAPLLARTGRTLQSAVEERGANLSAGERQIIAFARILAFQPEVMILDEATAHVDSETERIIQLATDKVTQGRTSLVIAHRLSTIERCDRIVVLDKGEIVEQGSLKELMSLKGRYYQLSEAQFKEELPV